MSAARAQDEATIASMRNRGETYGAIALALRQDGRTGARGAPWTASSVRLYALRWMANMDGTKGSCLTCDNPAVTAGRCPSCYQRHLRSAISANMPPARKAIRDVVGHLAGPEAADRLGVSLGEVRAWVTGRSTVPPVMHSIVSTLLDQLNADRPEVCDALLAINS